MTLNYNRSKLQVVTAIPIKESFELSTAKKVILEQSIPHNLRSTTLAKLIKLVKVASLSYVTVPMKLKQL